MWDLKGYQLNSNRGICWALLTAFILLPMLVAGCATMTKQEPPTFDGTFSGNMPDGRPAKITLSQVDNTISGQGMVGGYAFSLSGIASWYSPVILSFEEDSVKTAYLSLSPNGETANVLGLGESVILKRGGYPLTTPTGPFAGRYASGETFTPATLWLSLSQHDALLAGTGYIRGKPVAVVGKIIEPNQARGSLLFSDESRSRVTVTLSDDNGMLTVRGFGAPIRLSRQ